MDIGLSRNFTIREQRHYFDNCGNFECTNYKSALALVETSRFIFGHTTKVTKIRIQVDI